MEAKCYRAMRRAQCVVLKKFSQHVIAETRTEDGFGDKDGGRFRRQGWRMVTETRMEDGNVYGVIGVHHVKPCGTTI